MAAEYKDGVLEVVVKGGAPREVAAKGKQVEVKVQAAK